MSNPNRIDPLAPPPPMAPRPPSALKLWGLRLGISMLGIGLGASCPLWPPAVMPICRVLALAVQGATSAVPAPPEPPADED